MSAYPLATNATAIRREGAWTQLGSDAGINAYETTFDAAALYFKATATDGTLGLHAFQTGLKAAVYRAAVGSEGTYNAWTLVGRFTFANTSTYADVTLATGLDTTTEYRWLVTFSGTQATKGGQFITEILVGSLNTAALTQRSSIAWVGDSVIASVGGTSSDSSLGDPWNVSLLLDMACENRGIGGTTVRNVSGSDTTSGEARTADWTGISPTPALAVFRYGLNDSGQVKGAETAAQLQTSYTNMLTLTTATWTGVPIYNASIIKTDTGSGYPTDRSTWDAAISASVAAVNTLRGNSNCVFLDTSVWTEYTASQAGGQTADKIHPTVAGYALLTNREVPRLASAGYTLAVSGSGLNATATLTRAAGSTWVSGETVTLAWGDTNTTVVTPTAGQTTATATHTYGSAGSKTVSGTNAQGWTDPSSASFTAGSGHKVLRRFTQVRGLPRQVR